MIRKICLIIIALMFMFTGCKKENIDANEEERMVPVTFELSLNPDGKSYFGDLLPFGNIKWGNGSGVEYLYLSLPYKCSNYIIGVGTRTHGELLEMTAEISEPTDKLVFKGMVASNNLQNAKKYYLYYFGNNGQGNENTNVENYHTDYKNILIGKKLSFAQQTGSLDDLGNYHLAKINVKVKLIKDSDGVVQSFELVTDDLMNINSIAKLDLTGETSLGGSVAEVQSYTVLWNYTTKTFDEIIEVIPNAKIDVSNNCGSNSYISLLPIMDCAYLECSKGRYYFKKGVESNSLYIGSYADDINDALPLYWDKNL